ncbi:hypothetical protein I3760_02G118600 [Carya illinoinensis]|uniref:G protein gamma domain-containing protein n=1 Tax=Carya illinoinensis TaxID=32201 RepID=A0A8T1RD64_CARIL|nr:guanine nucleotide-binding protein subunit gamma 2-like isoform X2 [Carya illinoinensis]KAG2722210.1 hypothetical protein I3760_02G118600 [Carya illinoinensis]KAG6664806.1 hypothetical protein CIPAW_02G118700 [Carya illinoinensis]
MQSGRSGSARPITHLDHSLSASEYLTSSDTRGKHRVQAGIKRLEQEARFLEEELEQLEKMESSSSSSSCKEMLSNVEPRPDPLLPMTNGPINPFWDRWFEGPQDSKGCRCKCWIL